MRTLLALALSAVVSFGLLACSGGGSVDTSKDLAQVEQEAKAADAPALQSLVDNYKAEIAKHEPELKELEGKLKDAMAKALGGAKTDVDAIKADVDKLTAKLKALRDRAEIYARELAAKLK